jgi:hypothetical protein
MLSIFKRIKKYIEIKYDLARLDITEKTIIVISVVVEVFIIVILSSVILLVLSLSLANYLGECWGSTGLALLAVAGIDLLLLLIFIFFRDKFVLKPLSKKLIHNLVKQDSKEEDEEIDI